MSATSRDRQKKGGTFCSAANCSNAYYKDSCREKSFFCFPSDEARCRAWVQNCRRADLMGKKAHYLHKVCRLCSDHFEENQFTTPEKKRLNWNAVPTIFNVPNPPMPMTTKRSAPRDRSHGSPSQKRKRHAATAGVCSKEPAEDETCTAPPDDSKDPENEMAKAENLKRKLSRVRNQLYRRKKKDCKEKISKKEKAAKRQNASMQELERKLSEFFSGTTLEFLRTQLRLINRKRQGFRWKDTDKAFALSLFHASPKAYRILKQLFLLPSVNTLRRIMRKIRVYPGFNRIILKALQTKISSMPANSELCCVTFDEMALKEAVEYNEEKDYVEGVEDFGSNGRTKYVANHATVFMARGLIFPWKQTVGYALSSGPIKYNDLYALLLECIESLENSGLNVKVVIADQGSNNRKMFETCCKISAENPYFYANGKKVFVMYDPPHLLKNVRNNLRKHGFLVNGNEISWAHIQKFYDLDKRNQIRVAPKLTDKHIDLPPFAPLRVKFAAQVLSHSVASGISLLATSGIFSDDVLPTAHFLENFDQLFNAFNSRNLQSSQKMGHGLSEHSGHQEFLQSTLEWLQSISLPATSRVGKLPCLTGWTMDIRTLLQLWNHLHTNHGVKFLLTNRLNQDCLENLFSTIRGRGGHGDNPSAQQFRIRLRQAMVDSFFAHSQSSNCEEDHDKSLLALSALMETSQGTDTLECEPAKAKNETEEHLDPRILEKLCTTTALISNDDSLRHMQENVLCYISGFIAKKMQGKVCEDCSHLLTGSGRGRNSEMLIVQKQFEGIHGEGLVFPSEQLTTAITKAEESYRMNIERVLHTDKLKKRLMDLLEKSICNDTTLECPTKKCPVRRLIVRTFLNVRLHFTLRDCSRSFRGNARKNRKLMKVIHV